MFNLLAFVFCFAYVIYAVSAGMNILAAVFAGTIVFLFLVVLGGWVLELIQTSLRFIFMIGLLIYKALEKLFRKN